MDLAPHLHVVDADTGEIQDGCPDCVALEKELRTKRAQITKLKNENARLMGVEPGHEQILEVLEFACNLLMPNATITAGSRRWMQVRARLREPDARTGGLQFTPLKLKGAALGASMDAWTMDNRQRHRRDPEFVFSDAGKVDRHIQRAMSFRSRTGTSALAIIDELAGEGLEWLTERCSCEGLFIEHLRSGLTDGRLPCPARGCENFDHLNAKVNRWMREHQ